MKYKSLIVLSVSLLFAGATASAQEQEQKKVKVFHCPYEGTDNLEKLSDAIDNAIKNNDLYIAAELASECANYGSGIDVSIISPVLEAYEKNFEANQESAGSVPLLTYNVLREACIKKNSHPGSLYKSMLAHCVLNSAKAIDSAFGLEENN